jgi:DNA polymerase-3 subunit beta
MQCTCDRETLLRQLQIAVRGVSTRTSIQVLGGIMLAARDGELHLAATDMELSVRTRLAAEISGEGVAIVPGKLLVDIVRHLSGDDVQLKLDDRSFTVASEQSQYTLNTYAEDDFPQLPATGGSLLSVDKDAFVGSIQSVSKSASHDESRPVLTGVQVKLTADMLTMVATDSYRLSVKEAGVSTSVTDTMEAIIPARALDELSRIADASAAGALSFGIEAGHVLFGIDETWVTARRIEGQFPNHQQLIPQSFEHVAKIDRAELLDVVNRARLMAQRNSPLRLAFGDGELVVSATTQDVGGAVETLPIQYDGEPLTIGFNADFLRDGIQSVDGELLSIQLISPLRPGLLRGEAESLSYLLMPVRLPD